MKKLQQALIVAYLTLLSNNCFSQTKKEDPTLAGIYLTHVDFQTGKLTYDIDCNKEKQKIKLHDFFFKPYIDVYHKGEKHTLQKKDVYGYIDCDNNTFRFFDSEEYQLAESGSLSLYFLEKNVAIGKGFKTEKVYYFSAKPDGEIKPLTLMNLKSAFPDNHKFHDALDETFKVEIEISEYDTFHKTYKVNHVYETALK